MMKTNDIKMIHSISWLSSTLVGVLALASFSLSFEALRELAIDRGVVSRSLGWIFPLIVDGAIVVFSLCALRASLRKEKVQWLRGLVIFSTCGSVLFNMAHVSPEWLARVLAATPPILLFLSFEALMHSIQAEMERVIESHKPPKLKNDLEKKEDNKAKSPVARVSLKKADRLAKVKSFKEQGLSPTQIVGQLENVSLRTVQRDIETIKNQRKI